MSVLSAPLKNNINHKQTVFGGSLYSVSVLTGWSMVYVLLKQLEISAHIVIHHSEIDYLLPVNSDFTSCCEIKDQLQIERFKKIYQRRKKARVKLVSEVIINQQVAVRFTGVYVVHQ